MTTFVFLVPRPKVSVCHAWCAKMVKFVGMKAVVDGNPGDGLWWVTGRRRRRRSSGCMAWRTVNDFIKGWPPKRRPLILDDGLKEFFEFGWLCFCFLCLFLLCSLSSMVVKGD